MRLNLDGRATDALDEGLHRLYVFTNAMRRSLPMHIYENVISVVTGEDALPVRYGVGDSACVYEDPLVREGGEQTAPVSDAERRVQYDRLPNSVDVAFGDAVPPKDGSSQIGALDLETSLACRVLTESKIVQDGGGEEQVLVIVGVIQTALMVGQPA